MEQTVHQKKQLTAEVSALLIKTLNGHAGINEAVLYKIVKQAAKKFVKKYFRAVKEANNESK
jgi:hypothetical protein